MSIDTKVKDNILTGISPMDAFEILGIKYTENKSFLQMNYHKLVLELQENGTEAIEFANLRVAYEVIAKFIENHENPEETIDVSNLLEAIEKLAYLQEIRARYIAATMRENGFFDNRYEGDKSNEGGSNAKLEIEDEDYGYPNYIDAEELLKKLESMHFKNGENCPDSIIAESYYQMIFVCSIMPLKKGELTLRMKQFDYAKKALDKEKDTEYLFWCGFLLSQSKNKDNIEQSITYLSEAKKEIVGHFREGNVYWWLSYCYDDKEDFKNAFLYAKKATDYYPEFIEPYRILGSTAYELLITTSNPMYADAAIKAFSLALSGQVDFWQDTWVYETLCKIYTQSCNWGMLEKICGEPEYTMLNTFAFNYYKGIALLNRRKAKEALQFFKNAFEINADNHSRYDYNLCINISRCYEEIGIYEKALEWMKEFQQFRFNEINYPKECMMHFFLRKKKYEEAKRMVEQFSTLKDDKELIKFRIEFCEANSDEKRKNVIENVKKYMPYIQETELNYKKDGYNVERGGVWTVEVACRIGDTYWYILKDDEKAIRYYELSINLVKYFSGISENYSKPKLKASYGHYMLMRIYGEQGNKKKMQEHADAFMDYIKEYYSDDDSKTVEEQYVSALNGLAPIAFSSDYGCIYIKPTGEMGTKYSGDYNACKLAYYYISLGNASRAQKIAVNLAKKYKKDIPAEIFVLMGDLARVIGDSKQAYHMYRLALEKNPWEAVKVVRYLY